MARKRTSKSEAIPIDAVRHKDTRKNIPTEELRDFVREEENKPQTVLYPRDPSLDPQLVWKGKDEQDAQPLTVPAVPVYIQEKIHPQAIIEDFRRTADNRSDNDGADFGGLFDDFNGLDGDFDRKVDFYAHDQHWSNRMILGDSLLVMTSLAEKEGLKGKVQCIYFDPPYGIKFGSNWQVSTRKRDVKDGKAEDATRQPEQIRAFRDTWKLGIHSYLAYMRDRLVTARELLTESGSIFVQIGDENIHLVRSILDETFGADNFAALITFRKKNMPFGAKLLEGMVDYILWYGRDKERVKYHDLFVPKDVQGASRWNLVELPDGSSRVMTRDEWLNHRLLPSGSRVYTHLSLRPSGFNANQVFDVTFKGKTYHPPRGGSWTTTLVGVRRLIASNRIGVENENLRFRLFHDDFPVERINNFWTDTTGAAEKNYIVQTMDKVVERCMLMATDPGDLVLDPTCGSGTTAHVAEQWGRRWIAIDTSRVALALARTRLMTARFPYYLLADSPEGVKKEAELTAKMPPPHKTEGDIRKGFVYERVPHITLGGIANNADITEGMTRQQIDAAIARHAETETLYDKPYEDKGRLRVTGPFTVESLSPHRTISVQEKKELGEKGRGGRTLRVYGPGGFARTILDNLRKAGVQNTIKQERLRFDSLEPYPGEWIHGEGRYTEKSSAGETPVPQSTGGTPVPHKNTGETPVPQPQQEKRAAICIGPEFGTVGPELVKEAAKEAVKGVGFDLLIVCGFAFDPHVSEECQRYGKLTVLAARMNPDLAMGDELLKKTGAGNLFMVFGEPDIKMEEVHGQDARATQITVEIRGLDVYDPTTGEIRSNTTDDIACWFIDSDYDGESFFVRQAYFTGADEPYEKLKRALRAEIDEAAWSALYSTKSRPFEKPQSGRIAVKVINHYGDEVMKVFAVS